MQERQGASVVSLATMQNELSGVNERLRELKTDREDLILFYNQVSSDRGQFSSQLEGKRTSAKKLYEVDNSNIAQGLATYVAKQLGGKFEGGVGDAFSGMQGSISCAIDEINAEIRSLQTQISNLESDIETEKKRLKDEEEAKRHTQEAQ